MAGKSAAGVGSIRKKTVTRKGKTYTYWEARYTAGYDPGTGRQIQRSITGKTQKEVSQKLKAATTSIDNGTYIAPNRITTSAWLQEWANVYLVNVRQSTVNLYKQIIRSHLTPNIGTIRLDRLSGRDIQCAYKKLIEKPMAYKTLQNVHSVLHKALAQAVKLGMIRSNPSDACELPKAAQREILPLTVVQTNDFLHAIRGHTYELLYKVALFTGMREGELLGLQWDCVDFEAGTILIDKQLCRDRSNGTYFLSVPKNGKPRTLQPAALVMDLLRMQKAQQAEQKLLAGEIWTDTGLVFTTPIGDHLSPAIVYNKFKKIVQTIGVPTARFHDLRHTYAVNALRAGDDIKTVQHNLGHATAGFTLNVYAHFTEDMQHDSAIRMQAFAEKFLG